MKAIAGVVLCFGISIGMTTKAMKLRDRQEITSPLQLVQLALNSKYPQLKFKVMSYTRSGIYNKQLLNQTLGRIHDWVSGEAPSYEVEISQPDDGATFTSQALIYSEDCSAKVILTGEIIKKIFGSGTDVVQTGEIQVNTCP